MSKFFDATTGLKGGLTQIDHILIKAETTF